MPAFPCSNPGLYDAKNHQPNRTPSNFPNHPHSQFVHDVPFQAIHIPNPHAGYQPQPKPYPRHLSKPSTIPNPYMRYHSKPSTSPCHTLGTNHSLFRATGTCPIQSNHHPNPYTRYLAKLSTFPIHTPGTRPNHYRSTHIS
jgi:hypothetical protein